MGCAICSDNIINKNNSRKKSNLEKRKKAINQKYSILYQKINEINNYFSEIQYYISSKNFEIYDDNELDQIYLNYENIKKKLKIKDEMNIEIKNDLNDIEILIEKLKNNKQDELELIFKKINDNINKIEISYKIDKEIETDIENNIENLSKELFNLEQLKKDIISMNYLEIKNQIQELQNLINDKLILYNTAQNEINKLLENIKQEPKIDEKYLNNSMLIYVPLEFINNNRSIIEKTDSKRKNLLINNWEEKCIIYDEYDLYERNFEYQAVELPERISVSIKEIPFIKDKIIKIIEFTIDGEKVDYKFENSKLKFKKIALKSLQTRKLYIKYEQSNILIENQKKLRKIYREDLYGISKNLKGTYAKFYLIIKNDMEIINFDDEIFIKINEDEYKIEDIIPNEGKMTRVILSKKNAKFNIYYTKRIETKSKKAFIKNTKLILHYYFQDGGNKKNNFKFIQETNPPNRITNINKIEREFTVEFNHIKQNYAEVIIKGELINHCSGEYKCNLTEEQIDKEIPEEYIKKKEEFKKIAKDIINDYDVKHKYEPIKITDIAKIGKWIYKNILYDEKEKSNSALEIYQKRKGVCTQYTILFNALLYSLGYKCIYVSGFVIKDNDGFKSTDAHSWSIVRINGKWLPFDATWGIFSGKLPVSHIFENYFSKANFVVTKDKLIYNDDVYGIFIE